MLAELTGFNHKDIGGIATTLNGGCIIPAIYKVFLSKYLPFAYKSKSYGLYRMCLLE
jgi:hypothetical protein